MDAIKTAVSAMTTKAEIDSYLSQITAICKERKAHIRAQEKEIAKKARNEKIANAKAIMNGIASGSTIKVLLKHEPTDVEYIEKDDDKITVKINGKKRKVSYNQLIIS